MINDREANTTDRNGTAEVVRQNRIRRASKYLDEDKNACIKAQNFAFKCMEEHDFDRTKCFKHFENYKNCREFWNYVTKDRKSKGLIPNLPAPEDRDEIKKQYSQIIQQLK